VGSLLAFVEFAEPERHPLMNKTVAASTKIAVMIAFCLFIIG